MPTERMQTSEASTINFKDDTMELAVFLFYTRWRACVKF